MILLASDFLIAGACSGGVCGVAVPHIPTDIQNNVQLKPFDLSNKKPTDKAYNGWALIDNAGDDATGENRLMSGVDIHSLLGAGDKLSLFGLISSEDLLSGKLSYAYTLPWNDVIVEASYINTNYSLGEPFPGATGIGITQSIEGKITYPVIDTKKEKLNFSLYFNSNSIEDEIDNTFNVSTSEKKSYTATALIDYEVKNYQLIGLETDHKLSLGITTGNLSFDNKFYEEIDQLGAKTRGSFTKINIDYINTISLFPNISLDSKFRAQYALSDKNLDDSEAITIGGINGVKIYEEGSVYGSNGLYASIEGKYKLPEFKGVNNTIGIFYDYGQVWESDTLTDSNDKITVSDAGVGVYTHYKKFFLKIQAAFKMRDSAVLTKDDEDYRVLLQAGMIF